MKYILQHLLFPEVGFCVDEKMYFRTKYNKTRYFLSNPEIIMNNNEEVTFDTYFNSFSMNKWGRYTSINHISLAIEISGKFIVNIYCVTEVDNDIVRTLMESTVVESSQRKEMEIHIGHEKVDGIYYFEMRALADDSYFYGGYYFCETQAEPNNVNLLINLWVQDDKRNSNLDFLYKMIYVDKKWNLNEKIELLIVHDDSTNSSDKKINSKVHYVSEKEIGEAGRYVNGILYAKELERKYNITHILQVKNDSILSPETLFRTTTFLEWLLPQYKDAFLGGAIFDSSYRNIQLEVGEIIGANGTRKLNANYNMTNIKNIIGNELDNTKASFCRWFYCAMPISAINVDNLPLPLYQSYIDTEYSLRNHIVYLTLNGICLWDDDKYVQHSTGLIYYTWRNRCILNAIHHKRIGKKEIIAQLKKDFRYYISRYQYKNVELCLQGIEDFLKGIEYIKSLEVEYNHNKIVDMGYELKPIEDLDFRYIHGVYEVNKNPVKENRKRKLIRQCSSNGFLLKAKKSILLPINGADLSHFYRALNVIYYDEKTNRGYKVSKSFGKAYQLFKKYRKLVKQIKKDYNRVSLEYRNRYKELITQSFWQEYLTSPVDTYEKQSGQTISRWNLRRCTKELVKITVQKGLRGIQHLLWWYPMKKNRISVYVHKRKGYTCNPKYIVEKLRENYPNKYEMIWISEEPNTCEELRKRNVKVVKTGSISHIIAHFTSKVVISNDCLSHTLVKRKKQLYINTWHGAMNYKRIGYDSLVFPRKIQLYSFKKQNIEPDIFVSGCSFFKDNTASAFRFSKDIFIESGLPRNDILFSDYKKVADEIKEKFGIPKEGRVLIYAPTFRRGCKAETYNLNFRKLVATLEEKYGGTWYIFFRTHNFVKQSCPIHNERVIDVSNYDDMQELLCASDFMISDYSSCMWDFSLTKQPCISYVPDLESYQSNDRSFAYPLHKWPYPIVKNNEELIEAIKNFDLDSYIIKVSEHHKELGCFDKGNASEIICKKIDDFCMHK